MKCDGNEPKTFCERISHLAVGGFENFWGLAASPIFRCVCYSPYGSDYLPSWPSLGGGNPGTPAYVGMIGIILRRQKNTSRYL